MFWVLSDVYSVLYLKQERWKMEERAEFTTKEKNFPSRQIQSVKRNREWAA